MKSFCISLNESSLNKVFAAAYANDTVRQKLTGNEKISIGEEVINVNWNVNGKPTVCFKDIDDSREAFDADGNKLSFNGDMFTVSAPIALKAEESDGSNLPLEIVAIAYLENNAVSFKIVGLMIDDKSYTAFDRGILKGICPDLITSINNVLGFKDASSKPHIFTLNFLKNLGITAPCQGLQKSSGKIDIWGSSNNNNPYPNASTDKDYSVIISNELLVDVLNKNFQAHISECHCSKDFDKTASAGFLGHFGVKAHVDAAARNAVCRGVDGNNLKMGLSPKLNFSGKVILVGTPAGSLGYDYSFNPDPIPCKANIKFNNNLIHCELNDFDRFGVLLTPTGSVITKIESGLLWALSEAITNFITGIIPSVINIPFDINIPAVDIDLIDNVLLKMNFGSLSTHFDGGSMSVDGQVTAVVK